jgi:hypothetical protein
MQTTRPENTIGQGSYKGLFDRISPFLSQQPADQQFKFDTAMWYGAITQPGSAWKADVLKRLFLVLYHGGLVVHRDAGWVSWANQNQPICASICHGARVLICLPEDDNNNEFWTWLWAGHEPETRGAATHGVKPANAIEDIFPPFEVMKGIVETKGDENVEHFGINIALGGNGRMNPISGKTISENGKHGHLYIAYYKEIKHRFRRNEVVARKAILVNCEQSAPFDRQVAVKGSSGKVKSFFRGINVPDQYGGGHGLGGHSRFAATGGDDFSYVSKSGLAPTQLGAFGPSQGHYYDGMYIDLSSRRFDVVKAAHWQDSIIGESGNAPVAPPTRARRGGVNLGRRGV